MAWAPTRQDVDGCWLWAGGRTVGGYGQARPGGRSGRFVYVHRAAYEAYVGPIPDGLHIDHLCRVTACYNPAHLEAVTPAENTRRQPNAIALISRSHCAHGHPMDGTRLKANGTRIRRCLTCHRERERKRRVSA